MILNLPSGSELVLILRIRVHPCNYLSASSRVAPIFGAWTALSARFAHTIREIGPDRRDRRVEGIVFVIPRFGLDGGRDVHGGI